MWTIRSLTDADTSLLEEVAGLLVDGFGTHWPEAWPDLAAARAEVRESLAEGRISRVAVDQEGHALGWVAGLQFALPHVWELHPLVVAAASQRRGLGRALVADLEACVRARGGTAVLLGSDDETGMTTLGGVDLYPDPLAHLAALRDLSGHPFEFYRRCGYAIVGVIPDAGGPGKHDILMCRRL